MTFNSTGPKDFLKIFAGVFIFAVLFEIFLRILGFTFPALKERWNPDTVGRISRAVSDPNLGVRPNPLFPTHDEHGFRNPSVPKTAECLALGDSLTYGDSVPAYQIWPARLSSLTGRTTYNMAFEKEYGPIHYFFLLQEGLSLHPKTVIVGLNLGDDLYDTFRKVYADANLQGLRTQDSATSRAIEELEVKDPLERKMKKADDLRRDRESLRRQKYVRSKYPLRSFLRGHFYTYRFFSALKQKIFSPPKRPVSLQEDTDWSAYEEMVKASPNVFESFRRGRIQTVFAPQSKGFALDTQDIRIAEGLRISLEILRQMQDQLHKENKSLVVLLLPTKESVFSGLARQYGIAMSPLYERLVQQEREVRKTVKEYLKAHEIEFLDPLPALQESLRLEESPYFISSQDQLNRAGHEIVASQLVPVLKRLAVKKRMVGLQGLARSDVSRGPVFKVLALVGAILFVWILLGTKVQNKKRPFFLFCLYMTAVLLQLWKMGDFFPLSTFSAFSWPEEKAATYVKLTGLLDDGREVPVPPHKVLPLLKEGKIKFYVLRALQDQDGADDFAAAYAQAYEARYGKGGKEKVRELIFELWKWDFFYSPYDPDRGFVLRRVIGKPAPKVTHA